MEWGVYVCAGPLQYLFVVSNEVSEAWVALFSL